MAKYISLYSGSSGNCSVVEENGKFIIIDMGKSAKATNTALKELDLNIKNLQGILVSHEHSDHISGLKVFLKKLDIPVYTHPLTAKYLKANQLIPQHTNIFEVEDEYFDVGNFRVKGFETPHDSVSCMGYRIETEKGNKMAIATDLGHVTDDIFNNLNNVNLAVVESNYDEQMLRYGPYPYYLKQRISSDNGHLSNVQSSLTTINLIKNGVDKIQLCHLSNNNNLPSLALDEIKSQALANGVVLGKDAIIKVNRRNSITENTEF